MRGVSPPALHAGLFRQRVGQNFDERHFSSDPGESFYCFGDLERVHHCGAGAYSCGSGAGTRGYMTARELVENLDHDSSLLTTMSAAHDSQSNFRWIARLVEA